ncbi:AbfB domain-containing protein [Methylobacterium durans]|uniref:AbfB domain-containing protein n=1 Tax=Methylobacterium durans TaxID=2202825 RepID=UPI002AFE6338|nr:AbfB domain-containing protein [Methylobacterium durans]MEA1832125.1 AbfB domain-containing protein [Methylobacterium durans]
MPRSTRSTPRHAAIRGPALALAALGLIAMPVKSGAASLGRWSGVIDWPRIPVHAMILPDGRLMTYGSPAGAAQTGLEYDIWDPKRGTGPGSHLTLPTGLAFDSFCAAIILQPWSGAAMLTGGYSLTGTAVYDPQNLRATMIGPTRYPRWYGTFTAMPDGRVAIQGGMTGNGWDTHSITPELFTPGKGWTELGGATSADAYGRVRADGRANYPRAWAVSTTKLFTITGQVMFYLDVSGQGSISGMQPFNRSNWGATSTAVMFRPGRILQLGGGSPLNNGVTTDGSRAATVIDIGGAAPVLTEAAPMAYPRHWANATVLPNGEVLVTGGGQGDNDGRGPAYTAEIWNPATGRWRQDAAQARMRLYHSVSILLPDGRVLSGGGGIPGPQSNFDVELYTPGYLLDDAGNAAARPAITAAPGLVTPGQSFQITATGGISRVTMIKTGAVTHSYDADQRFIELSFQGSGTLTVAAPKDYVAATPGYYMLFVLDAKGTPSEAKIVKVPVPTSADDRIAPGSRPSNGWTAAVGTTRGGLWNIRCENGEVMAGLYGTADAGVGGVGARCVTAAGGRWTANPRSFGAGLDARPPFTRDCPRDQAISAIGGQASEQATQIVVTCSPMNAANGSAGGGGKLAAVGNGGGNAVADSPCPDGGSAYGLYGEGNARGNRIGLLCRNGAAPAAPVSPANPSGSGVPALPTTAISLESASTPGYYARPVDANLTVAAAQASGAADKAAAAYTLIPGLSGAGVSFRSVAKPTEHLTHAWFTIFQRGEASGGGTFRSDASFTRRSALAPACGCTSGACLSYESVSWPGYFVRNRGGQLGIDARQETADFAQSASFCERLALGGDGGASLTGPLSLQSSAEPTQYVTSTDAGIRLTAPATGADRNRATFRKVAGLNGSGVSFESSLSPGQYLRHAAFQIWQEPSDGGAIFKAGATFTPFPALAGACTCSGICQTYESVDWRGYFLRQESGGVFMRQNDGTAAFRQAASFCEAPPLSESAGTAPPSPTATTWTPCAQEGGTCTVAGTQTVRYGANGVYATRTVSGSVGCNNGVFGDPLYGTVKSCETMSATVTTQ